MSVPGSALRSSTAVVALALATLAGPAACQVLLGIDDPDATRRPPDAAAAGAKFCGTQPPAKKGPDTGVGPTPLFFAIRTVATITDLGPVSYNIDQHCTFADADVPCVGSPDDPDGGIDDAFATLVSSLPGNGGTDPFSTDVTKRISTGRQGVFMALYHYSQQPNDGEVELGIVSAPVLAGTDCDASAPTDDAAPPVQPYPKWDGCDVWSLGDITFRGPQVLPNAQPGYVVDGTLVAHFDELTVSLGVVTLHILDAVVTAQISKSLNGNWSLANGVVAGRLRASEFIQEAAELYVHGIGAGPSSPICTIPGFPAELRDRVCRARDIRVGDDNTSATCDGLSLGVSFEAEPAAFGVNGYAGPGPACAPIDTTCP